MKVDSYLKMDFIDIQMSNTAQELLPHAIKILAKIEKIGSQEQF